MGLLATVETQAKLLPQPGGMEGEDLLLPSVFSWR